MECAEYIADKEENTRSDLFTPIELMVEGIDPKDGEVTGRMFFLAEVEAFDGVCCVVPDIGGKSNGYFQVKNRDQWSGLFANWLKRAHKEDKMVLDDQKGEHRFGYIKQVAVGNRAGDIQTDAHGGGAVTDG